jgi:diguanylate cyclase (GGDEF)-like protein/PAS domain S-box-containing protein
MKQRLDLRITIVVVLIALLVAGVASVISYRYTYSQTFSQARHTLTKLAETVQPTASIAVFIDNREIADEVISGLTRHEFVEAVFLTGQSGLNVKNGAASVQENRADAVFLQLESPFTPGEMVGKLTLLPKRTLIESKAQKNALTVALLLGGFTVLIALVVTQIVQYMFIQPLRQVTTSLNAIIPGDTVLVLAPKNHQKDEIGELTQYLSHLLGIVKQKLDAERSLREEYQGLERRFRMIFERAGIGIFLLDSNGRLLMANNSFKKLIGATYDQQIESCTKNCLSSIFQDSEAVEQMLNEVVTQSTSASGDLLLNVNADGEDRWVHCLFTRVLDETGEALLGETIMQGIINDITDRKKREQIITFQAEHDPLTHLLNRRSVEEKLRAALRKAEAGDYCITLFMIDLDKFKPINDTYGHEAGDRVLIEVARRLTGCLRQADVVGRLGGDEFLAATIGTYSPDGTHKVAEKLLHSLGEEIAVQGGVAVCIGASIGISLSSIHGTDLDELVSKADRAMYQVKSSGRNGYLVHV